MDQLAALNPEQRDAVLQIDGPLLILAGAGSGKTRVIAQRIAYLISERFARPDEILAVTFTNKAAEELRTRVETLLGASMSGSWMSTFHSLCARLLRREATAIGLPRDFVIYDSSDQVALVKQVMKELQIDDSAFPPRQALSKISHAKNTMAGPEFFRNTQWSHRGEQMAKIYEKYLEGLRDNGALDFDDLLLKSVELLDKVPHVRERYAEKFRFVMVDEYQDTNRPQYHLIQQLSQRHRNLCVVGDPDQSIYRWRGADLRNILDFEQDFPEAKIVKLERNYRSTQVILDAASAVISMNRNRKEKRLWTERKGGERIRYFRGSDDLEEADFITRTAHASISGEPDCTVAILYRMNSQSRVIEDALMRSGMAYRIVGGVRFYERKEIKDALGYLKLLINPNDDVSLRRVINVPTRGIGKGVIDAIERISTEEAPPLLAAGGIALPAPRSLWTKLNRAVDERLVPPRAAASLRAFRDLIVNLSDVARKEDLSIVLGKILDQTGYLQDLRDDKSEDSQNRLDNLMELVSAAREYEQREPEASLGGFTDRLSLLSEADEEQGTRDARIWLMTLHSAKGLEFPTVIMAGLEEGVFPHSRSFEEQDELDEERRLCYVGMTRARTQLVLTGAARRRVFGEYQSMEPSRFMDEVPAELVDRIEPAYTPSSYQNSYQGSFAGRDFGRANGPGRAGMYGRSRGRAREPESSYTPTYNYENEDQSALLGLRLGAKVRHPQFGVGTILSVEELADDVKLVVRFSVGSKTLRAKYAKLEMV
ncbi:MAG TPA: UvrD-helicase domain-containing protein [Vicinamibacterales bacterium]|nr:UvrD-helicase domain-containing protein [Vicinamibacterales bacterium]